MLSILGASHLPYVASYPGLLRFFAGFNSCSQLFRLVSSPTSDSASSRRGENCPWKFNPCRCRSRAGTQCVVSPRARDSWTELRGVAAARLPGQDAEARRARCSCKSAAQRNCGFGIASESPLPAAVASDTWQPLGPVPLASDASGNGTQDYHQVSGRATAVAIDPADPSGNTIFIGGAQGGVWQSANAANSTASSVTWTPVTDDQATLSVGLDRHPAGKYEPGHERDSGGHGRSEQLG